MWRSFCAEWKSLRNAIRFRAHAAVIASDWISSRTIGRLGQKLPVDVGAHETEGIETDYWEDSDNLAVLSESFAISRDFVKVPGVKVTLI